MHCYFIGCYFIVYYFGIQAVFDVIFVAVIFLTYLSQHTTKKRKSLLKQWHNNNFSHEPPLCQTLTDSVKY